MVCGRRVYSDSWWNGLHEGELLIMVTTLHVTLIVKTLPTGLKYFRCGWGRGILGSMELPRALQPAQKRARW